MSNPLVILKQLQASKAAKNATASYLAFFSNAVCALLSMALAFHFLDKSEIGLWMVINQVVGYLVWLDLGMGDGLGRKIAPALASGDCAEASTWWTASWCMLIILGFVVLLVSICALPLALVWLNVPTPLQNEATWLFLGASLLVAINLPSRMYPGILLAQERFHWVPMVQSVVPWIQIAVFACLLQAGEGLRAFLGSVAASQLISFAAFLILVHCSGPAQGKLRLTRLHWGRTRELLGFSGSLTILGLSNAIIASLPAIIIGRHGGLASVPPFGFTQRAPTMISSLVLKTSLSFYPALQRMQVEGKQKEFIGKYSRVLDLTLAAGLISAGTVVAFNRALVEWVAAPAFFAGHWTNIWFAAGLVLGPLAASLMHLLQYSGVMGKVAWVSLLQLAIYAGLSSWVWREFGLPGMSALLVLLPWVTTAPYALIRGSRACGFNTPALLLPVIGRAAALATLIFACGVVLDRWVSSGFTLSSFASSWPLPSPAELACGATLFLIGLFLFWASLRDLRTPVPKFS